MDHADVGRACEVLGRVVVEWSAPRKCWRAEIDRLWWKNPSWDRNTCVFSFEADDPSSAVLLLWEWLTQRRGDLIPGPVSFEAAQKPLPRRRWDGTRFRKYPPLKSRKETP